MPYMLMVALGIIIVFITIVFLVNRYRKCPSDKILVVYGFMFGEGRSSKCIHGGGTFVWPLIQDYAYMSLTPMTINIPLTGALSQQNIRINVPSSFTVQISPDENIMGNAADCLLNQSVDDIEDMARNIIIGQLRLTVASLTIEEINGDRENFQTKIRINVEPELNKIGLNLINVNITDITDEADYIASIGKKAASEAVNKAKVDVAIQDKLGSIGESEARKDKDIQVANNDASAQKGIKKAEAEKRCYVADQESLAIKGENEAKQTIALSNAELKVIEAEAFRKAEVAKREAEVEIQKAQYSAEKQRLNAAEVAKQEIDKQKIIIEAEAAAEKARQIAQGDADAILFKYKAEAEGQKALLEAKAEGYKRLVQSAGDDVNAASTLLMIEKLQDIVTLQTEAIRNIKIDKVTVWDRGNGSGDGKTSTADFLSGMVKSLPPLHDVAKMAGLQLPTYLGSVGGKEEQAADQAAAAATAAPKANPKA
ncbi:MAG: flotillin family protein [Ruminobacter sp.]|uniref:flotillin family protein n=1 Tax=Ruminobacter sp. TaxID=2774296 RepID=UPI00257A10C5|nr:flotillin family protein [Ruminobacter sp.]MBQ3775116.1 flotillin family protein [Ruminobacter sp.]